MAVATAFPASHDFTAGLDDLLLQVCEEIQLPPARYDQAVERYEALGTLLESEGSPFQYLGPKIYPQGSMALGTTVKPLEGPHDLDFVLELSLPHDRVNPMQLIGSLHRFLRAHGVYGPMTSTKNRCVRVEYANDFYMDILPACRDAAKTGSCVKVPDRAVGGWCDSDPLGYIKWFESRSRVVFFGPTLDKAAPIPPQQAVAEKMSLPLAVQLLKRWRDQCYDDPHLAPISIVLTTLAGHTYRGERSVSRAITSILSGTVQLIDTARAEGGRLKVPNPSNPTEDLSEKWGNNPSAYAAFENGIRDFARQWSELLGRVGNGNAELQALFGEPVGTVLRKRAEQRREARSVGSLGVTSSGLITSAARAAAPLRPHTFYGKE